MITNVKSSSKRYNVNDSILYMHNYLSQYKTSVSIITKTVYYFCHEEFEAWIPDMVIVRVLSIKLYYSALQSSLFSTNMNCFYQVSMKRGVDVNRLMNTLKKVKHTLLSSYYLKGCLCYLN